MWINILIDFPPITERQEVSSHVVRVKEEEEPMEVDSLVASDLVHNRPITKEITPPSLEMGSHRLFSIKAEDQMSEQLHQAGAKMADQCLHGLKIEDAFYTGSKSVVSGANKFQFRVKMEDNGTKMADQLLSGAKMADQLLFKAKLAERPFSVANMSNKFLSGAKMEGQFPPGGVKMENQLLFGTKMESRLLPGAKMAAEHVFSGVKTEEQLFFGAKMEDQCLRAVLWQDMSVNLASTLLHQLSGNNTNRLSVLVQFQRHYVREVY